MEVRLTENRSKIIDHVGNPMWFIFANINKNITFTGAFI